MQYQEVSSYVLPFYSEFLDTSCSQKGNRICSKIEYEQQNDPWNVERFLEDLLLVVKGQSNLDIDGYL